jgi:peptidoglycan/xylan/chitin deacetylase (PgdA/CDA1 family)
MSLSVRLSIAIFASALIVAAATPVPTSAEAPAAEKPRITKVLKRYERKLSHALGELLAELEPAGKVIHAGRRKSGAVALTFDDGNNARACRRIAHLLRKRDAVGTFFVNGMHLLRQPNKWRQIIGDMPVGNHTRSHPDLRRERHPVVHRQIAQNEQIHERVLGRPMLKLMRPPYGSRSDRVARIAGDLDYDVMLWNVDTNDWKANATAKRIARRATGVRPGSVVLMHCSRTATVKALPKIIRHYEKRNIDLVGLDTLLGLEAEEPSSG